MLVIPNFTTKSQVELDTVYAVIRGLNYLMENTAITCEVKIRFYVSEAAILADKPIQEQNQPIPYNQLPISGTFNGALPHEVVGPFVDQWLKANFWPNATIQ